MNLTVESSLPYQVNGFLEDEIKNNNGTNIVDKSILSIKAHNESEYKSFMSVGDLITLLTSKRIPLLNWA